MKQALADYEAAGGAKVDPARVRYWRLLFQAGFSSHSRPDDPAAPPPVARPDAPEGPHAFVRDAALMADAMGVLAGTRFAPLD